MENIITNGTSSWEENENVSCLHQLSVLLKTTKQMHINKFVYVDETQIKS